MNTNKIFKKIISFLYYKKRNCVYEKKIDFILKHLGEKKFDKSIVKEHIKKWKPLYPKVKDRWFKVYSIVNGKEDINYVPENIYYCIIEPILNNIQLSKCYSNKNFYDCYFGKSLFPENIVRNIEGKFYSNEYQLLDIKVDIDLFEYLNAFEKIIIKPAIDSGGGNKIDLFKKKENVFVNQDNIKLSLDYLFKNFYRNYLIQKYIIQHSFFEKFNPTSVNTIRIFTYRSVRTENIISLHSLLRIGKKNSIVDNQASGGISCAIKDDGRLNDFAVDKYGNKYFKSNGIEFGLNQSVPMFKDIVNLAKEIAKKNHYTRLLGLDFCVDSYSNIKLIEINNINNEINFYQMNNGPLFREYTDEVINYCCKNKRSFVLDFYVE